MYFLIKKRSLIPYISYLTYGGFWKKYLQNFHFDENDKEFKTYLKRCFDHLPEYVYEPYRKELLYQENKSIAHKLYTISKYFIEDDNNNIFIQKKKFEEWQGLISICSPIPLIASYIYKSKTLNVMNYLKKYSILPTLNLPVKNEFDTITDLHIHINGASETYYSWEKALSNPKKFIDSYDNKHFNKNSLEHLVIQTNTTMDEFFHLIKYAKIAREILVLFLSGEKIKIDYSDFKNSLEQYKTRLKIKDRKRHPYQIINNLEATNYYYELLMYFDFFKMNKNDEMEKLLHFYILAQSQFERILVQQVTQNGFRQFLYISDNMIRDIYEDDGFEERFLQLQDSSLKYKKINLEVRITPGNFIKKYQKIVNTYNDLINKGDIDQNSYFLSVVCHFIKFKDPNLRNKYVKKIISEERYSKTKSKMQEFSKSFLGALLPALSGPLDTTDMLKHFVGIDAAGYELYSPPEAFAPIFKYIRKNLEKKGKKIGLTFHAGEDFVHIISGIRYIYEAYTFLDYRLGDRIGHANALGVNPKEWREKLNNTIYMKRGEWLDNLLFFAKKTNMTDERIKRIIKVLWNKIYSVKLKTYDEILSIGYKAYLLRQYEFNEKSLSLLDELQDDNQEQIIQIYKEYLFESKYDIYCNIELEERFDQYIKSLQNIILIEMSQKGIIIESMISSNVRITYYERYKQHHILEWLDKKHNMPLVTLASDDPGIFNNNIFIEYSHLYEMVDNDYEKFNNYLKILEESGNKASFLNQYTSL